MQVLFVHGMGRSSISGWPLMWQLRRAGLSCSSLGYWVSRESFEAIVGRLAARIRTLLAEGPLVLVGHSLGGVLLRAALVRLLRHELRRVSHLFLLGSPVRSTRLARTLSTKAWFRFATGDCGQLLASERRMGEIGLPLVRTTAIVGTRGIVHPKGPFGLEPNDGVVAISEVEANWLPDQVRIEVFHTLLPSSRRVGRIILDRLRLP